MRRGLGTHPAVYLIARAYAVPLLALFASILAAALAGVDGKVVPLAAFLLAMCEAAWTCAVTTLLVACKPQWLATWSDALYLGPRAPAAPRLQT